MHAKAIGAHLPLQRLALMAALALSPFFLTIPVQSYGLEQSDVATPNDLWADVGARIPAFGGIFVDEAKDTLYVYMVPGLAGDQSQLDQVLTGVFGDSRPAHRLELLTGQYTFLQLKDWHDRLNPQVFRLAGVVRSGIDQGANGLRVGVERADVTTAVQAELDVLGIPRDAVKIETVAAEKNFDDRSVVSDPYEAVKGTLRDFFRPLVGGIQIVIGYRVAGDRVGYACSIGFNATRGKENGLVTARHCVTGNLDGADIYQARIGAGQRISPTGPDCCFIPPVFDNSKNNKCPKDRLCRYSDSAFIRLLDGVQATMGGVARPDLNSNKWDGKNTFSITSKADKTKVVKGMTVTRVGAFTGRVEGKVDDTCTDYAGGDDTIYLCQLDIDWDSNATQGDSGGPVFAITDKDKNQVQLVGIIWATTHGVSPIWNIEVTDELGPTLLACAAGSKC